MVGFCTGNAYSVLLCDDRKHVETKVVKICKGDGIVSKGAGYENEAINFDMSNDDIIFDNQSAEKEEGAQYEHHSDEATSGSGTNDSRMARSNHESQNIDFETLAYYPGRRCSERRTAGKTPNRY